MNEIQQKLLGMVKWFHSLCSDNRLRYYILGGTMLGAVRHKGFIPWDDDIDVGLPRKDYERLKEILKHKNGKFVLEAPLEKDDYAYSYCKLYDTSTTLIEKKRFNPKRGIYIDVFPLDGIGSDEQESKKNYKKIKSKINYLSTKTCALRKGRKFYKNAAIIISRILPGPSWKKTILKINSMGASRDFDESVYIGNLMGAWGYKEVMKREVLGEPTEYVFEDTKLYGPADYDSYLKSLYGNYMQPPPPEKQKSHHDYIYLNLSESYLDNKFIREKGF